MRSNAFVGPAALLLGAASCARPSALPYFDERIRPPAANSTTGESARPVRAASNVSDVTRSPWPPHTAGGDPRSTTLSGACGRADGVLTRVAFRLAEERAKGHGSPDPERVVVLLRENGAPHVRPRVLLGSGHDVLDDDALRTQLEAMKRPTTRCGVGIARTDQGKELLVGVAVDALADLDPLPIRARTGEWLTFTARARVPTSNAKLIVLPPRGVPRTVPTSSDAKGVVRARFALERPGGFTVQLIGEVEGGPKPLLEARVFADVAPDFDEGPAPGEEAGPGEGDDADALGRMTSALRASESLPPLARSRSLDALARSHAENMRESRAIAHDVGDGDLRARFENESLTAKEIGENVARARSVELAHRTLHTSPSHRMNLLHAYYTHIGLGVVRDDAGTVYACEVFASQLR